MIGTRCSGEMQIGFARSLINEIFLNAEPTSSADAAPRLEPLRDAGRFGAKTVVPSLFKKVDKDAGSNINVSEEYELEGVEELVAWVRRELGGSTVAVDYAPGSSPYERRVNEILERMGVRLNIVEHSGSRPMYRIGNVVFYGAPWGAELLSLAAVIVDSVKGFEGREEVGELLRGVNAKIVVFVSSWCPYCPYAVRSAARIAMSAGITCEVWMCDDFPEEAEKNEIHSVPSTIIEADGEQLYLIPGYSSKYVILLISALEMVKEKQK